MKTSSLLWLTLCTALFACQNQSSKVTADTAKKPAEAIEMMATAPSLNYSFVVMGCNRISYHDDDQAWKSSKWHNEAHANLNQLYASFDDVMKMSPLPDFFFFTGDLVLCENKDTNVLAEQLRGWKKLYYAHPISKSTVKMVALPGNHEFLYSEAPDYIEYSSEYSSQVWLRLMKDFIVGNNGPGKGGPDKLMQDQSQLTYSIDYKGDHFVLMNTDTYNEPGMLPTEWLTNDINSWRAKNSTGHIFLMGHKPAYNAAGQAAGQSSDPGLAASTHPDQVTNLWKTMTTNRCEAMLSAHEHLFWAGQPVAAGPWQIIAGNAGTSLESGDFFGFTEVQVMTDGTVSAVSHGRPVPAPNDWGPNTGSTTVRNTYDITWGK